jgi:phosphoribosylglycinamide formyltransferase 1
VPVQAGDDEERLAARILAAEHRLYPLAVRLFAEGRLQILGNTVRIAGAPAPDVALFNPLAALASTSG